ncbi:hypothetical protein Bbelb_221510 [Branchiostoma belcheri]|nr:hypothetical protein Bbelb_221510 [Branchiostoma belcheri]
MHTTKLEDIPSSAFNGVSARNLSLYNNPVTRTLDSLAFTNIRVTGDLMLYGNSKLTAIAEEAFSSVNVWSSLDGHGTLDLSNCAIKVIVGKMFTSGSRVKNLDISNNLLVSIPEGCFQLQPTVQKM